jgi:predicted PurR-regulated permease PerM
MRPPNDAMRLPTELPDVAFVRRVLIVVAIVALALLLWQVRETLLLAFAGVLVAVLLRALARPIELQLTLSPALALAIVSVLLAVLLGLVATMLGGDIAAQLGALAARMPALAEELATQHGLRVPWATPGDASASLGLSAIGTVARQVMGLGAGMLDALAALIVAVVGGVFLASAPRMYRRGVAMLLPHRQRGAALRAMVACGRALRLWMGAQLVAMVVVGVLSGLGAWAIGLPAPMALGLFAGFANVVPFLGAFAGAVPALLLAAAGGTEMLLWTSVLFLAIQQLEGNLVTPLAERSLVSMPPALLIFAVVAVGTLFGLPGVILAAPLTVVLFVLVKKLYIRHTLGTPTEVPGEPGANADPPAPPQDVVPVAGRDSSHR